MSESQKAFEKWFVCKYPSDSLRKIKSKYKFSRAIVAWESWQAAAQWADGE